MPGAAKIEDDRVDSGADERVKVTDRRAGKVDERVRSICVSGSALLVDKRVGD